MRLSGIHSKSPVRRDQDGCVAADVIDIAQ